ncbi:hypothetical protein OW715_12575 [Acidithiobacillus ferriphilus]|nr:hypothetical protein [Acidithiobacillus ferriphilus]
MPILLDILPVVYPVDDPPQKTFFRENGTEKNRLPGRRSAHHPSRKSSTGQTKPPQKASTEPKSERKIKKGYGRRFPGRRRRFPGKRCVKIVYRVDREECRRDLRRRHASSWDLLVSYIVAQITRSTMVTAGDFSGACRTLTAVFRIMIY